MHTSTQWSFVRRPVRRVIQGQSTLFQPRVPVTTGTHVTYLLQSRSTATLRRKKPVGVDLLFQGQPYARKRVVYSAPPFEFTSLPAWYRLANGGTSSYLGAEDGQVNVSSGCFKEDDMLYDAPGYAGYAGVGSRAIGVLFHANSSIGCATDNELRIMLGNQKLDTLTNVLEAKKTAQMFKELGNPLMRSTEEYVKDLKRYLRKERRRYAGERALGIPGVRLTKTLANLHLAYVFGVKPLLMELEGAMELLMEPETTIIKARSTRRFPYETRPETYQVSTAPGEHAGGFSVTTVHKGEIRYHYHLYGELNLSGHGRDIWRLGVNPLATAWELVPWSFAVDRLVTIGDSLASMGALTGVKRHICYETRVHTQVSRRVSNLSSVEHICKRKEIARVIRPLTWSLPRLTFDFGQAQVVTYSALLRQQLGRFSSLLKER